MVKQTFSSYIIFKQYIIYRTVFTQSFNENLLSTCYMSGWMLGKQHLTIQMRNIPVRIEFIFLWKETATKLL